MAGGSAAILQYYSRLPYNITTGANTKQATSQRPCAAGYSLTADGGLNPCTEGLTGTVIVRNAGTGFDFFGLNARLSRTFLLTERIKLEGMAEAFNSLNHRNDMIPNATWGSGSYPANPNASFGQATSVGDRAAYNSLCALTFDRGWLAREPVPDATSALVSSEISTQRNSQCLKSTPPRPHSPHATLRSALPSLALAPSAAPSHGFSPSHSLRSSS